MTLDLMQYQLGQRVMFDCECWPEPAPRRWLPGMVVELIDTLLGDDYAVRRRVVVVREVIGDHVARSGAYRFEPQDAAGIRPASLAVALPPRAFALARIASMADRPFAWASTREAFGLQLVTLVEMARGTRPTGASAEAMRAVFGRGPTIGEGYDDAWAREAAEAARALIEAPQADAAVVADEAAEYVLPELRLDKASLEETERLIAVVMSHPGSESLEIKQRLLAHYRLRLLAAVERDKRAP